MDFTPLLKETLNKLNIETTKMSDYEKGVFSEYIKTRTFKRTIMEHIETLIKNNDQLEGETWESLQLLAEKKVDEMIKNLVI